MTDREREYWDERWTEGSYTSRASSSPFLDDWLPHVPRGRALDLACGTGRNALRLAEQGFEVTAMDVSVVAIDRARATAAERGLDVDWQVADLDEAELGGPWDLVTVFRYRNPGLWPRIADALAPNGWVLVEHHLSTPLDAGGPSTDDFRLAPQELLAAFGHLRVVHYEEVVEPSDHPDLPDTRFVSARIAAVHGDPGY